MGQIIIVLVASGPNVTETTYGSAKTAIQSAITTFNTNNANVNLALNTQNSQYIATG